MFWLYGVIRNVETIKQLAECMFNLKVVGIHFRVVHFFIFPLVSFTAVLRQVGCRLFQFPSYLPYLSSAIDTPPAEVIVRVHLCVPLPFTVPPPVKSWLFTDAPDKVKSPSGTGL